MSTAIPAHCNKRVSATRTAAALTWSAKAIPQVPDVNERAVIRPPRACGSGASTSHRRRHSLTRFHRLYEAIYNQAWAFTVLTLEKGNVNEHLPWSGFSREGRD